MTPPYHADATTTVWAGDCLDVLRELPDASVDAVVTDPPYDLTNRTPDVLGCVDCGRTLGGRDGTPEVCPRCGGELTRQRSKQGRGFMGKEWDGTGIAFRPEVWRECLRVLKPGGHMLAFGGTRTWHRLACAVEDAGFEIRDSIAWLYGSGFPKSLDVSKAIDKAAGAEREVIGSRILRGRAAQSTQEKGGTYTAGALSSAGMTKVEEFTAPATDAARTWQGWGTALKPAFEPIVVARKPLSAPGVNVLAAVESSLRGQGVDGEIRWTSGPVSGAGRQSPATASSTTPRLRTAEASAKTAVDGGTPNSEKQTVSGSGTPTLPGETPTASTSAPTTDARLPNSVTKCSTHTGEPAPAATSEPASSSPLTTSTEAAPLTAKQSGARSTARSSGSDSRTVTESFAGTATGLTGSWATVRIDRLSDGTFVWPDGLPRNTAGGSTVAANVLQWGTGALNVDGCRVGFASESDRQSAQTLADLRAKGRRLGVLGKPGQGDSLAASVTGDSRTGTEPVATNPAGRWPANVVLDESQAAALDKQSRDVGGSTRADDGGTPIRTAMAGGTMENRAGGYADTGGASRFFFVAESDNVTDREGGTIESCDGDQALPLDALDSRFTYTAKAGADERVRLNGVAHPTVKPLSLMRWLVRLVTPPGGLVLDPFAGSGTTVEACILEGFRCTAIEREADYLPLIAQRINRRRDPVAAVRAAAEDAGLFDLLDPGEETA